MVDLIAKSACADLLPLTVGKTVLSEQGFCPLTALMPFNGKADALSAALEGAHGVSLPKPNHSTLHQSARVLWFGQRQFLLVGPEPDAALAEHAALVDQSDAWAVVLLEGAGAEEVLARLVPVDFRAPVFATGQTVRSELMHMMASITRTGPQSFMILVFRSMAATLVHDVKTAMEAVAARG